MDVVRTELSRSLEPLPGHVSSRTAPHGVVSRPVRIGCRLAQVESMAKLSSCLESSSSDLLSFRFIAFRSTFSFLSQLLTHEFMHLVKMINSFLTLLLPLSLLLALERLSNHDLELIGSLILNLLEHTRKSTVQFLLSDPRGIDMVC